MSQQNFQQNTPFQQQQQQQYQQQPYGYQQQPQQPQSIWSQAGTLLQKGAAWTAGGAEKTEETLKDPNLGEKIKTKAHEVAKQTKETAESLHQDMKKAWNDLNQPNPQQQQNPQYPQPYPQQQYPPQQPPQYPQQQPPQYPQQQPPQYPPQQVPQQYPQPQQQQYPQTGENAKKI